MIFSCATCHIDIEKLRQCEIKSAIQREYMFCSKECAAVARRVGGLISKRTQLTNIERFGVDNPGKSLSVRNKRQQTCLERYGVKHHWQLSEIRNKTNWNLRNQRGHETMKQRGSYGKSKIEDVFYECLCEVYGHENVERQVTCPNTHWPIDFYVKVIDTYIQFDGVYWHGLDRPLDFIAKSTVKRDVQIYRKYLTDRTQDLWFKENGLKLIRITDKQFMQNGYQTDDAFFQRDEAVFLRNRGFVV